MTKLKELSLQRQQAEKCVSCGLCLYSCPVYAEEHDENYVARGRNRIVKEAIDNPEELIAGMKDRFSKCLLCRRCTMVCPQGVRTDMITIAARAELAKSKGLPLIKRVVLREIMKDRNRMKKAVRAASRLQWLLPVTKEVEGKLREARNAGTSVSAENPALPMRDSKAHDNSHESEGKIRHIPLYLAGMAGGRQLPSIAKKFLSEQIQEITSPPIIVARKNHRIAFFSGCTTEFCFPETGKSLIRLLNQLGVEVVFPKEQGCCGMPALASGDLETAREMALHNLKVFLDLNVDFVVTGCATCGSTLKDGWASYVAKTEEEKVVFERFGSCVRDISEFVVELAEFKALRFSSLLPANTKVTYHDPCHLARYQGVIEQPREILKRVFGDNFVEMDNNGCCGLGGAFSIDHYELSKKIAKKKVESIARTKADVVITSCPGCMIQLIDNIERHHLPQRVIDIVEAVEPVPDLGDTVTFESLRTKLSG